MKRQIILIAHNVRSCHNVGSLLRTADGLGVERVFLTGYTPYPRAKSDARLPHIAKRVHDQIKKTALGAEESVAWEFSPDVFGVIERLRSEGFSVVALEQTKASLELPAWQPPPKIALVVGRETEGIEQTVLEVCDQAVEIPMFGEKESFNVVQAAAMALYQARFSHGS